MQSRFCKIDWLVLPSSVFYPGRAEKAFHVCWSHDHSLNPAILDQALPVGRIGPKTLKFIHEIDKAAAWNPRRAKRTSPWPLKRSKEPWRGSWTRICRTLSGAFATTRRRRCVQFVLSRDWQIGTVTGRSFNGLMLLGFLSGAMWRTNPDTTVRTCNKGMLLKIDSSPGKHH